VSIVVGFVFCVLFSQGLCILCHFCFLDFAAFGLFLQYGTGQVIVWEECVWSNLFCVELVIKPYIGDHAGNTVENYASCCQQRHVGNKLCSNISKLWVPTYASQRV